MPPLMLMASAYRKRLQLSTKWGWKFRNRRLRAVFSAPELAGEVLGQLFHHAGSVGQGQSGGGQGLGVGPAAAGGTQGVIPGPAVCGVGVIGGLQLLGADDGQGVADDIPGGHIQGHVGE